jgi:hypothetical protein
MAGHGSEPLLTDIACFYAVVRNAASFRELVTQEEGLPMFHVIKLQATGTFDLIPTDRRQRVERVSPKVGTIFEGEVHCYVTADMVEVADIRLADGSGVLEGVPCKCSTELEQKGVTCRDQRHQAQNHSKVQAVVTSAVTPLQAVVTGIIARLSCLELPMPIIVTCSRCDARIRAPEIAAGRKAKCPKCRAEIVVPRPESGSISPSPRPAFPVDKPVEVVCPVCRETISVPPEMMGQTIHCPCGIHFAVGPKSVEGTKAPLPDYLEGFDAEEDDRPQPFPENQSDAPRMEIIQREAFASPPPQPESLAPSSPVPSVDRGELTRLRCYDCGKRIYENELVRRDVQVHHSKREYQNDSLGENNSYGLGASLGNKGHYRFRSSHRSGSSSRRSSSKGSSERWERVNFCAACNREWDEAEQEHHRRLQEHHRRLAEIQEAARRANETALAESKAEEAAKLAKAKEEMKKGCGIGCLALVVVWVLLLVCGFR